MEGDSKSDSEDVLVTSNSFSILEQNADDLETLISKPLVHMHH